MNSDIKKEKHSEKDSECFFDIGNKIERTLF